MIELFKTQTDVSATSDIILHFILGLPKIRGLTLCQEYINLHSYCRCCLADHVVTEGQKCEKQPAGAPYGFRCKKREGPLNQY